MSLPPRKRGSLTLNDYLLKAEPDGRPIRSAIPESVEAAKKEAREAADSAADAAMAADAAALGAAASAGDTEKSRRTLEIGVLIALLFGILSAVGVITSLYSLVAQADGRIDALRSEVLGAQQGLGGVGTPTATVLGGPSNVQRISQLQNRLDTVWLWTRAGLVSVLLVSFFAVAFSVWRTRRAKTPEPGNTASQAPPSTPP